MRCKIVRASQLKDDWRAERFCEPSAEEIQEAKRVGWTCGAKGTKEFPDKWAKHGSATVRRHFHTAFIAGRNARNKFFKSNDGSRGSVV